MKKVFMLPTPAEARNDDSNSINQIVLRLQDKLLMYGWQITEDEAEADIVAIHAGQTTRDIKCDVAHCHGLYPTAEFKNIHWHYRANHNVINTLKQAQRITVPSGWVSEIIERDMNIKPDIVRWAIDRSEWHNGEHKSFTLWNKTRVSSVCDPAPIQYLAAQIPDALFVSTFAPDNAPELNNLRLLGRQPFTTMKDVIHNASVYLATTKETFGIGVLEAMASGSPVLGYNWGSVPEIVEHGVTGYLVEPNDLQGLVTGWKWIMRYRRMLSYNARQHAIDSFYGWERVAQHFANIYDEVLAEKEQHNQAPDITVIIPNHNYDEWVIEAARSAINQSTARNYEVIVLNDKCDNDQTPIMEQIAHIAAQRLNCTFRWEDVDFGSVAKVRNHGASISNSKYIMCLDADDQLARPDALELFAQALDNDEALGVAYGKLGVFKGSIHDGVHSSPFPDVYNGGGQLDAKNQIPSCCMFRRVAFEQSGGYRQHLEPAEDAGLWTTFALHGWGGKLVADEIFYYYRMHDESLSAQVRKQEKVHPPYWELDGSFYTKQYPFASVAPLNKFPSHPVMNYDTPLVSVIIPVGAGHEDNVIRAVDSVAGQTSREWECIVINDTGKPLKIPQKWVRVVGTGIIPRGAGYARNAGIDIARGDYLVFLDADDKLEPRFIEETLLTAQASEKYIYTDWYDATRKHCKSQLYAQDAIFTQTSIHAVTVLIKKEWVQAVGGFDETMLAWEDTDLFMKLATEGYCGMRVPQPLFEYDYKTGKRRDAGLDNKTELTGVLTARYGDYMKGDKMACKCKELSQQPIDNAMQDSDMIEVLMVTGSTGGQPIVGAVTKTRYGTRKRGDRFYMYPSDARAYPKKYKHVAPEQTIKQTVEPPAPAQVAEYKL